MAPMRMDGVGPEPESREGGSPACPEREIKFVVAPELAARFLDAIAPHTTPEIFDPLRPIAWTRTTYLDTSDFSWFRASASGGIARKLRIRQYASACDEGSPAVLGASCFLELKESGHELRTKCRFASTPALIAEMVRSGGDVSVDIPPTGAFETLRRVLRRDRPLPRVTTWYRRVSRRGDGVRITVDSSLSFARAEMPGEAGEPAPPRVTLGTFPFEIVEVKHAGAVPEWLADAARVLPAGASFSKFREAMACLGIRL